MSLSVLQTINQAQLPKIQFTQITTNDLRRIRLDNFEIKFQIDIDLLTHTAKYSSSRDNSIKINGFAAKMTPLSIEFKSSAHSSLWPELFFAPASSK